MTSKANDGHVLIVKTFWNKLKFNYIILSYYPRSDGMTIMIPWRTFFIVDPSQSFQQTRIPHGMKTVLLGRIS